MEVLLPLFDWVLVRVLPEASQSAGGIILPDQRKRDVLKRVTVLQVGKGPYLINGQQVDPPVEKGQTLLIHKAAGHKVYEDQEDLLFIKAGDSRAVVG